MFPSTQDCRGNLFLQYGPDYSFGRPNTGTPSHAGHGGNDISIRGRSQERGSLSSGDSNSSAHRTASALILYHSPEDLDPTMNSNRSPRLHQQPRLYEQQQGIAFHSSSGLAAHQHQQAQNGREAYPRQIRRTKSVEDLRFAHTSTHQPVEQATTPVFSGSESRYATGMHKSRSGPLRETMRRVFSRGDHVSSNNTPYSSKLALMRPRKLYSSSRTSGRSSQRLSVVQEAPDAFSKPDDRKRGNITTRPSPVKRSIDTLRSFSQDVRPQTGTGVAAPRANHPQPTTWTDPNSQPDVSTRSAQDLHDWFQAARASAEFGPPTAGTFPNRSMRPSTNERSSAGVPRSSGSAGSDTSFHSSTASQPAVPPPVRDPRRRPQEYIAWRARHQYHTSSLLAEAGSPSIQPPTSPRLKHQVSLPRAAMEIASLLARMTQLEEQILLVEETQARSRRQLHRIEGHLDAIVRGRKPHDTSRSRSSHAAERQEERRIPTPNTWLRGDSSASSVDEISSPHTPPDAAVELSRTLNLPEHENADPRTTAQDKLLRESLLREGYSMSLLKVFAVVNDEHDARLGLQEDVAYMRSAIEGMKQHLPHDVIDHAYPDRIAPRDVPANRGPSGTPIHDMGSRFSYDSSDDEIETSEGSTRPDDLAAPSDQPNVGLGLTTRDSGVEGGQERFSTPPLRPSSSK